MPTALNRALVLGAFDLEYGRYYTGMGGIPRNQSLLVGKGITVEKAGISNVINVEAPAAITANRTLVLPDKSGTLATLEDIPVSPTRSLNIRYIPNITTLGYDHVALGWAAGGVELSAGSVNIINVIQKCQLFGLFIYNRHTADVEVTFTLDNVNTVLSCVPGVTSIHTIPVMVAGIPQFLPKEEPIYVNANLRVTKTNAPISSSTILLVYCQYTLG